MTFNEAESAAIRRLPVILRPILGVPIEYDRICEVGHRYDEKGNRTEFVALIDKTHNSITYAAPNMCSLKEEKTHDSVPG